MDQSKTESQNKSLGERAETGPDSDPAGVPDTGPMDTGLACLVLLAHFLEKPSSPEQIAHQFGTSGKLFDETTILLAGKDLDLKCQAISAKWDRLGKTPLPAIASRADGTFFVLAKVAQREDEEEKVLIQDPAVGR
ncbi:MAG: hypothetical protein HN705_18475, partial [Rhodospirillales bacterium]|nr:hypothetical protein [Rhodospirillales bacterium]